MGKFSAVLGAALCLLYMSPALPAASNQEIELGYASDFAEISTHTILLNEQVSAQIDEIGQRLVKTFEAAEPAKEEEQPEYIFRVINDPLINAYSIPPGYVYVNTGLLDVLRNKEQLAAVLAHEIHHLKGRHLMKQINQQRASEVAGQVFGMALGIGLSVAVGSATAPSVSAYGTVNPFQSQMQQIAIQNAVNLGQAMGGVLTISMVTGYGKKQELEADLEGLKMMDQAGYDPQGMVTMFKQFIEYRNSFGKPPEGTGQKAPAPAPAVQVTLNSSLIKAEPGLDERLKQIEQALEKGLGSAPQKA